jgi:hypothetical protein
MSEQLSALRNVLASGLAWPGCGLAAWIRKHRPQEMRGFCQQRTHLSMTNIESSGLKEKCLSAYPAGKTGGARISLTT